MKVEELMSLGIPSELVGQLRANGLSILTSTQVSAIDAGLLSGKSLLISAPTSSGKTTIAELAAISAAQRGRKTVYLVTHKALAEEKYRYFKSTYDTEPNSWFDVTISTGDRHEGIWISGICIATYEKFLSLVATRAIEGIENLVVVADEIQTVADQTRGSDIELLCTIMLHARPFQMIGLTATMPNATELADWLGCEACEVTIRDVPLRQEIWSRGHVTYSFAGDGQVFVDEDRRVPTNVDTTGVATELVREGKFPVLVFCMTKRMAEELAESCAGDNHGRTGLSEIGRQLELFSEPTSLGRQLRNVTEARVAFHTADLSFSERAVVEQGIRAGKIDIVFATPTLAAGVNLPIRSVVFDSFSRPWVDPPWISQGEFTNMAGRAGRLGFHEQGDAILLPTNRIEYQIAQNYISDQPETVSSTLFNSSIRKPVLQLIASGICDSSNSLLAFFQRSLWFTQTQDKNTELADRLKPRIDESIQWLIDHQLCVNSNRGINATELGRSVSATGLLPSTAMEMLRHVQALAPSDVEKYEFALIHLVCATDEFQDGVGKRFLPFSRRNTAEVVAYKAVRKAAPFIDPDTVQNQDRVDNAAYILSLWAKGAPERDMNRAVPPIRYGQLQGIAQDVSWIFDGTCTLLSCPAIGGDPKLVTELELLSKRIRHGVTTDAIDVLEAATYANVPGFGRHRAMGLVENEVSQPNKLMEIKTDVLAELVDSSERALALLDAVANIFKKPMGFWKNRQLEYAREIGADVPLIEALYDKDGAEYENYVVTILKRMELDAELFDDGKKQGVPDILIRIPEGNLFIECKSRENKKGSPISTEDAFAVLTKANDLSPVHCVTVAKPAVGSHTKRKATSSGSLTIIEHRNLIQAYLAYFSGVIPKHRIISWLKQPGLAQEFDV